MAIALENSPRNAGRHLHKINARLHSDASTAANDRETCETVAKLTAMLVCAPIDLASISDEIRRHAELEALVLRLGVSLVLSPEQPVNTVEEAVVVLGTSRLRILLDVWATAAPLSADTGRRSPVSQSSGSASVATPEMRYLKNFLRSMGFETQENTSTQTHFADWVNRNSPEQMFALTDLFMRDFFSLLPVIQPGIRESSSESRAGRLQTSRGD